MKKKCCNISSNLKEIKAELNNENKNWKNNRNFRNNKISGWFSFDNNCLKQDLIVTIINALEIRVENYGLIKNFGNEEIVLMGRSNTLIISGNNLCIKCYTEDEILIKGYIKNLEFKKIYC